MAILSRKEFAILCNRPVTSINVGVSRGKVIVRNDKKIDTENVLNKLYLEGVQEIDKKKEKDSEKEMQKKIKTEAEKKVSEIIQKATEPTTEQLYESVVEKVSPPAPLPALQGNFDINKLKQEWENEFVNKQSEEASDWDLRKKIADAKEKEFKAQKAELDLQKSLGKLMPIEFVDRILVINIQSIFRNFENELINLASIYCDILAGGDRTKLSEIMGSIRERMEIIVKDSKDISKKEIESVVEQMTEANKTF